MLAVISDLHFAEEKSDEIAVPGHDAVGLARNVPAEHFHELFIDLVEAARREQAEKLTLVLAGDIFDLHRTQLWFGNGGLRPYVGLDEVQPNSLLENKIKGILRSIEMEPRVAASLQAIRDLRQGRYRARAGDDKSLRDVGLPVEMVYLPGNHDRLVNATPALRDRVCKALGLAHDPEDPFPHAHLCEDPPVLIRHGHEYDPYNFAAAGRFNGEIPADIPHEDYGRPAFGDLVTVALASGLPFHFRQVYGKEAIAADRELSSIYMRLLAFDDVRPASAVLAFLLGVDNPGARSREAWEKRVWELLEPVLGAVVDQLVADPFYYKAAPSVVPAWIRAAVATRFWRLGLPLWAAKAAQWLASRAAGDRAAAGAVREQVIREGRVRFVVAGHTHKPEMAHIGAHGRRKGDTLDHRHEGMKQYYVDTGTWRHAILANGSENSYGALNAAAYVVLKPRRPGTEEGSGAVNYWSGFLKEWPDPATVRGEAWRAFETTRSSSSAAVSAVR